MGRTSASFKVTRQSGQLSSKRRSLCKLHRQREEIEPMLLPKRPFPDLVLLAMVELAEANRPSIRWLHAHTCIGPAPDVRAFDRREPAARH